VQALTWVLRGVGLISAATVLVGLGAVLLLVSDARWRTALRELSDPAPADAAPDGPVYVLGGSSNRLPLALTLPGVPSPTRPLWVSAPGREGHATLVEHDLSCEHPHVTCVTPYPTSTYGEALALRGLLTEHHDVAPDATVTVVTSTFHVARTRWQLHACALPEGAPGAGIDVVVRSPGAGPAPVDRPRLEAIKLVNAGLRTACRTERSIARSITRSLERTTARGLDAHRDVLRQVVR
jgi:hypothetical protein